MVAIPVAEALRAPARTTHLFLLRMLGDESEVRLDHSDRPEFDSFTWVNFWYPVGNVVDFKRDVYQRALAHLAGVARKHGVDPGHAPAVEPPPLVTAR